jgi:predicted TIM-barrel fold metal-dependent hydrolase
MDGQYLERESLVAIDMHVRPWDSESLGILGGGRAKAMEGYFGRYPDPVSLDELADQYRGRSMMAVLQTSDDQTTSGLPPQSNDHIAAAVQRNPDVFLAFAGIDPWKGKMALDEMTRCGTGLGLRGLCFNAARQHFDPSDARFRPLWERAAELGLICLFHTGMVGMGAGQPGGMGIKLRYGNPLLLDDVAADFPELTIISAHPGWPWTSEQLAMLRHKANVYMDLSGVAPKYWPAEIMQQVKLIQDKLLFGTDWPVLTPERWLEEFEAYGVPIEIRSKILLGNARRILARGEK